MRRVLILSLQISLLVFLFFCVVGIEEISRILVARSDDKAALSLLGESVVVMGHHAGFAFLGLVSAFHGVPLAFVALRRKRAEERGRPDDLVTTLLIAGLVELVVLATLGFLAILTAVLSLHGVA